MEMATFAFDSGFADAIVRGLRSGFLTQAHYSQIANLGSLAELKSFLEDTDYGPYLINDGPNLPVSVLRSRLKRKVAEEIEYVKLNGCGKMAEFINRLLIRYQIDNVVNLIEGIKNKVDMGLLMASIDPLGYFPQIKNLKVLEGDDYTGLYQDVLIDTPVGPYFMRFLEESLSAGEGRTLSEVQNIFKEMKPEHIRTSLKKIWLQDFYAYCRSELDGESAEVLSDLISFEADLKAIQVVYNSMSPKDVSNLARVVTVRKQLCPAMGLLYPDSEKQMLGATNLDMLKEAVKVSSRYLNILKDAPDPSKKEQFSAATRTMDDIMYDEECKTYALVWDAAQQYGVIYSYLKLKEQEIRNIVWLAEMVARKLPKNHHGWKKIIVPFSHLLQ